MAEVTHDEIEFPCWQTSALELKDDQGRANPSIRDEPKDCTQRKQGVFRRINWNRSDAYCGKKISLVNPMRLA